jgi:predicted dehydrogenase
MILLIGAGPMAVDYAKVLQGLNVDFQVLCRTMKSADEFYKKTSISCLTGGIDILETEDVLRFSHVIVAVDVDSLYEVTSSLLSKGFMNILLEKPGAISSLHLASINEKADVIKASVLIGYNRRFYSSVERAKAIIHEDGGVQSFNFEITEWGHVISNIRTLSHEVKNNWFVANTTHIVDLAFYLCGRPRVLHTMTAGGVEWHNRASSFSGCGDTENDALFSYFGNWTGPGRLTLDIITKNYRIILCPIEKLQIQKVGEITSSFVECDDELDIKFKPGLFKQVEKFITNDTDQFCSISDQMNMIETYKRMAGYSS